MKEGVGQPDFASALASVSLFSGLGKKELQKAAELGQDLSFQAGQTIVKEGELGIGFYVILSGKAEVRRRGKVMTALGKGDFFGEMAVLGNQPRSADVVAVEPTRCAGYIARSFGALIHIRPEIPAAILVELVKRSAANASSK
ncbi:MAG: cyclic nucleotide-binding domain-containing protein [Conexivisphaerales archaeon]|jgi:CRP-like cAMP-binding protein